LLGNSGRTNKNATNKENICIKKLSPILLLLS
jgi:hypothetical protein